MSTDTTAPVMPELTSQQLFRKQAAGEAIHPDAEDSVHRHVLTVIIENTIGALNRVANLFSQRGFNLESVTVGEGLKPGQARLTLVTTGNDRIIAQVLKQLNGLIDVVCRSGLRQAEAQTLPSSFPIKTHRHQHMGGLGRGMGTSRPWRTANSWC